MNIQNEKRSRDEWFGLALLTLAMWATRSHHFVSIMHLPDASWAAFFLVGLMGTRVRAALWLLVNAGIIDYLALRSGVSSYCITPAYVFLVPTYLTLWASGRWASLAFAWTWRSITRTSLALGMGVIGAFIISNASFYALGGYFEHMPALQFANAVIVYLPRFLASTALYTLVAGLGAYVWQMARENVAVSG